MKLDLDEFSLINLARCEASNGFNHKLDSWDLGRWFTATLGELGEAANVAKKLFRVEDGIPGNDETPEQLREKLATELADAFIYLNLLAQRAGVKISDAVIKTFDAKSEKIGYPIRLQPKVDNSQVATESAKMVYSDPICKFNYCPSPALCAAKTHCVHPSAEVAVDERGVQLPRTQTWFAASPTPEPTRKPVEKTNPVPVPPQDRLKFPQLESRTPYASEVMQARLFVLLSHIREERRKRFNAAQKQLNERCNGACEFLTILRDAGREVVVDLWEDNGFIIIKMKMVDGFEYLSVETEATGALLTVLDDGKQQTRSISWSNRSIVLSGPITI